MTNTMTTVRELLAHYVENHEYGIKQNTIDCWLKPGVSKFEKWLERPALLIDLNLKTVNAYVDWLKANSSCGSARSRRGPLLLFIRYAVDLGLIKKFEGRIRKIKLVHKIPVGWDSPDVQKLMQLCLTDVVVTKSPVATKFHRNSIRHSVLPNGTRLGLFLAGVIAVAWDTTLRLGDVLQVRWTDLEYDSFGNAKGHIVMSKTGYPQDIAISSDTIRILKDIQRSRLEPSDKLLDWPYRREKLYDWVRAYVRESGVKKGTLKFIRKGSASAAERLERGAGRASLGHRSDTVSQNHYLDPSIVGVRDIAKPSLFRESEPTVQPATSNYLTPEEQAMLAMFRGRRQA